MSDRASWEERYRASHRVWSAKPNPSLRAEIEPLAPGEALDLGCGEGADAIWLAGRGWRVTAVDFARPALERAAAAGHAARVDHLIDWVEADLTAWQPPERSFDLVNIQYLHLREDTSEIALLRRAAEAVRPGGVLLIASHERLPHGATHDRPATMDHEPPQMVLRTAEENLEVLDLDESAWQVEVAERRSRAGHDPHGEPQPDHVLLVRRLAQR